MKPMHVGSEETRRVTDDSTYYMITLDPSVKEHRVIALLIDYTSRRQECPFYKKDDDGSYCSIAPDFTVMWDDCQGRCFVNGVPCSIILDHTEPARDQPRRET